MTAARKSESTVDHYATYLVARRDLSREAALTPERQAILRSWIVARAKLVKAAGRSSTVTLDEHTSISLLPPKFQVMYANLEQASPRDLGEWAEDVAAMERAIERARTRAGADRAEQRYERQAEHVDTSMTPSQRERKLRGKNVWLFHGTSSALLDDISRHGLRADQEPIDPDTTTAGYVYLTADIGSWSQGGSAWFYARRAASKFGGSPVILRVIVDFDDLEADEDDADLKSYAVQYRTAGGVPAGAIMEADGQRLRERYES